MSQPPREPSGLLASDSVISRLPLRSLLLVSAAFLVIQVVLTHYGAGHDGAAVFWMVIGGLLLWLVYPRRSRVAWGVTVVTALVGAVTYGLATPGSPQAAALALAYLGQAVPLMASPVRQHVQKRP